MERRKANEVEKTISEKILSENAIPIHEGPTTDMRIRKETAIELQRIKLDHGLFTYDDVLRFLIAQHQK